MLARLLARRLPMHRAETLPRERLLAKQREALGALRKHAYASSPFYREFHAGLHDAPLEALPVLTKRVMMERFDDLVTDRALRRADLERHLATVRGDETYRGYRVASSSGSMGTPAIFVFSADEWLALLSSFDRGSRWSGLAPRALARRRMASVTSTTPWHVTARATRCLESAWIPLLRLDAGEPVGRIVERLNDWRPELLLAYPSIARVLCAEQAAGRLAIAPKVLMTGSEVLTPAVREVIRQTWGILPFDQYAATDAGGIAAECEQHAGLHVFEDQVILEVVDRDCRPVPLGAPGEKLLVTVLARRTQPLIRYELTDMVQLTDAPCACGRPFLRIEHVQGRSDEWIALRGPDGRAVEVHPIVVARVLDRLPAAGWQLRVEPRSLTVQARGLAVDFDAGPLVRELGEALRAQGAAGVAIRLERVDDLVRGATGKAPRVLARPGPA